jgi:copper chaperone CopZ
MTCEMGCARTIESKISKLEGVKYSKVIFAKGIGQFTYDPKVISSKEIIQKINGIGGGNMYKVVDNQEVKNFSSKS